MKIENHRLIGNDGNAVPYKESPHHGGLVIPKYLIMHFTSGRSAQSSVDWFLDPEAKASAHVVIGRDGKITQCVPFNRVAWHAGKSKWEGLEGMNQYSLGIELDNAGKLEKKGGHWTAWFGGQVPDDQVMVATHKNEKDEAGWVIYTPEQLAAAAELAALLVQEYGLKDVLGHEDISPGRKNDPGPAFPMASFRSRAMGRETADEEFFVAATDLNIRTGPGTENATLTAKPMPKGTRMSVLEQDAIWWKVDVEDTIEGQMDLVGWVHSHWLEREGSPVLRQEEAAPSTVSYTPPVQSAHALAGVPFAKAKLAPRAEYYLAKFAAADQTTSYKNDPSKCATLLTLPGGVLYYDAKMAIDADGSPRYAQIDGSSGQSGTSHHYPSGPKDYFNAEKIPYFVLPQKDKKPGVDNFCRDMGIRLGDIAMVIYKDGMSGAIFADEGPSPRIGEGSIRLHELLPVPHSPWKTPAKKRIYNASVDDKVLVFVFPNSNIDARLTPATAEAEIQKEAARLFAALKTVT